MRRWTRSRTNQTSDSQQPGAVSPWLPTSSERTCSPMDDRTLEVLLGSIAKWEAIVAGTGRDLGGINCPLCREFILRIGKCRGCPVKAKTGRSGCRGTPYDEWSSSGAGDQPIESFDPIDRPRLVELAQAELEFLQELVPAQQPTSQQSPASSHQPQANSKGTSPMPKYILTWQEASGGILSTKHVQAANLTLVLLEAAELSTKGVEKEAEQVSVELLGEDC